MEAGREAVSVREAARIAGIGGTLIYEAIREGWGPPTVLIGKRRRVIRIPALRRWLADLEAEQQRASTNRAKPNGNDNG